MNNLKFFTVDDLGASRDGAPLPERLIEGEPQFKNWDVDSSSDEKVRTGVWETTPGTYRSIKGGTWEFCYILSGLSELTEDGKQPVLVRPGDAFVMKPDFTGVWRCIETTRKIWVVYI
ncbi:cupin domain-containing protein [Paraburkholderia dilworthii]|uniref:cupin domain-containing protein n=1 Tax=Paraburkholderia dilworthii TaxID=948106 RepID=UPI00041166C2|nr:cupin domain-containing protein [Paraburkholderia dilworthii]